MAPSIDKTLQSWASMLTSIIPGYKRYQFVVSQLVKVDLFNQYKKSYIGLLWLFFEPVYTVIIWIFMHLSGIIEPGESAVPYAVFVLLSTAIWSFFLNSFKATGNVLETNNRLITTARFPYHVLITSKCISYVTTFIIFFGFILIFLFSTSVTPDWRHLILPFTLIPLFLLGATMGLWNSLLKVVAIDFSKAFEYIVNLLKYSTPVIFTPKVESALLQTLSQNNPLSYLIGVPRDILLDTQLYSVLTYIWITIVVAVIFVLTVIYFQRKSKLIIERIIIS